MSSVFIIFQKKKKSMAHLNFFPNTLQTIIQSYCDKICLFCNQAFPIHLNVFIVILYRPKHVLRHVRIHYLFFVIMMFMRLFGKTM